MIKTHKYGAKRPFKLRSKGTADVSKKEILEEMVGRVQWLVGFALSSDGKVEKASQQLQLQEEELQRLREEKQAYMSSQIKKTSQLSQAYKRLDGSRTPAFPELESSEDLLDIGVAEKPSAADIQALTDSEQVLELKKKVRSLEKSYEEEKHSRGEIQAKYDKQLLKSEETLDNQKVLVINSAAQIGLNEKESRIQSLEDEVADLIRKLDEQLSINHNLNNAINEKGNVERSSLQKTQFEAKINALESRIRELESQSTQHLEEQNRSDAVDMEELRELSEEQNKKIDAYEQQINNLKNQAYTRVMNLQRELEEKHQQITYTEQTVTTLRQQADSASEEMKRTLDERSNKFNTYEQEIIGLKKQKRNLNKEVERLQRELDDIKNTTNAHQQEVIKFQKRTYAMDVRLQQALAERDESIESHNQAVASLNSTEALLNQRIAELQQEIKDRDDKINTCAQEVTNIKEKADTESNTCHTEIQMLQKENSSLKRLENIYNKRAREIERKMEELSKKEQSLTTQNEQLRKEKANHVCMANRVPPQASQIEESMKLSNEVEDLRRETSGQHEQFVLGSARDKGRFDDKLKGERREIRSTKETLDLQARISPKDKMLDAQIEMKDRQIENLNQKNIELKDEITKLSNDKEKIKSLERKERDLTTQIRKLKGHLATQETRIKTAQKEAMSEHKARHHARIKPAPDSFLNDIITTTLKESPEEWAKQYAAEALPNGSESQIAARLRNEWDSQAWGRKDIAAVLVQYQPRNVLAVTLVQYIIKHVMKEPFVRMHIGDEDSLGEKFAENISMLYNDFLEADETLACAWRSQTLRMLSRRDQILVNKKRETRDIPGVEEFPFPLSEQLARGFLTGPSRDLLKQLPPLSEEERCFQDLNKLIKQAAWVSFILWKQPEKVLYSYPHNETMILQPLVEAAWLDDGKPQTKTWAPAAVVDINSDSEEDEDDGSDSYPETD